MNQLLTITQLAKRFGKPVPTVSQAVDTDRFPVPPFSRIGRLKWLESEIEKWERTDPVFLWKHEIINGQMRCVKCKSWLAASEYERKNNRHSKVCRGCRALPKIKYEIENVEAQKKRRQTWLAKSRTTVTGRARSLLNSVNGRSSESDLTLEWIIDKIELGYCSVSGLPFDMSSGSRKRNAFAPSVDGRDNQLPYTENNCHVVSSMVNIGKNEWSELDFIAMCCAVAELHASNHHVIQRLKELRNAEF